MNIFFSFLICMGNPLFIFTRRIVEGGFIMEFTLSKKDIKFSRLEHLGHLPISGGRYGIHTVSQKLIIFLLLEHNKLLIVDNHLKRGIEGPSQCVLCKSFVVHDSHLFLDCKFSSKVLDEVFGNLCINIIMSEQIQVMIDNWKKHYPITLQKKKILKRV